MYFKQEKNDYKPYGIKIMPYGEKDSPVAKELQYLCYLSIAKLKEELKSFMKKQGYKVKEGKDYLYCYYKGSSLKDILLTAHIDTVQNPKGAKVIYVNKQNNKHYLWSPYGIGGDDRCGCHIIKQIIKKGYKPSVLFCDKEERGGIGSDEFAKKYRGLLDFKCILELDRQGKNDLVFYDEENEEWKKFLAELTGWKEAVGTFSDICNLYDFGCASVNLSVGYYHQHTKNEYIVYEEVIEAINTTELIINNIDQKWEHTEKKSKLYYDDYWWYKDYGYRDGETNNYLVHYINHNGCEDCDYIDAKTGKEAKEALSYYYDIPMENIISCECENDSYQNEYETI